MINQHIIGSHDSSKTQTVKQTEIEKIILLMENICFYILIKLFQLSSEFFPLCLEFPGHLLGKPVSERRL